MFYKKNVFILCSGFILIACMCFAQTKTIPYQELPNVPGSTAGSGMYFGASMSTTGITVVFEGPSDRWIALGFGTVMHPTDVLVYSCGHAMSTHPLGWFDYYNSSPNNSGVLVDPVQNWNILSSAAASQRTVVASRPLSTGDLNNDVVLNFNASHLNLVWARGASPDYTIAYHGGNNRVNGISLPWQSAPAASFGISSPTVCAGSAISFSNSSTGGQTSYSWTFQGGTPSGSNAEHPSVQYTSSGIYSVTLIAANSVGSDTSTQQYSITVTPTVPSSLSIGLSAGVNTVCAGSAVTFTAAAVNGGTSPFYQWQVNGANAGNNSPSFILPPLNGTVAITCVMSSNLICPSPASATSPAVSMTVYPSGPASTSIGIASGTNPLCEGLPLTFTVAGDNGGTYPGYQWQVNGLNAVSSGTVFIPGLTVPGAIVTCSMFSSSPCASPSSAISGAITMTIHPIPPAPTVVPAGPIYLCAGESVTLTSSVTDGNLWSDGTFLQHIVVSAQGNYSVARSVKGCVSAPSEAVDIHALDCTGLNPAGMKSTGLFAYPNPGNSHFLIRSASGKMEKIIVYTIYGKRVLTMDLKGKQETDLDLGGLPPGIYTAEIHVEGRSSNIRLLKTE